MKTAPDPNTRAGCVAALVDAYIAVTGDRSPASQAIADWAIGCGLSPLTAPQDGAPIEAFDAWRARLATVVEHDTIEQEVHS